MKNCIQHTIDFSIKGNLQDHIVSGWSAPEEDHVWSDGYFSSMIVRNFDAPFGFVLEFDCHPALNSPFLSAQTLTIEINGVPLGAFAISRRGLFGFRCPPVVAGGDYLHLKFGYQTPVRPSASAKSRDNRLLALCFRRIRIIVLHEPWHTLNRQTYSRKCLAIHPSEIIKEAELATGSSLEQVLQSFEMLSGNCDMGLALRELGFESMSLLRFGGANVDIALRGLENDFAGVEDGLTLWIAHNPMSEWMVKNNIGLNFHSGQSSESIQAEDLIPRFKTHLAFLRRKLIEDLDEGTKTFVFADHKDYAVNRTIEEVLPLYLGLSRRSTAPLLWVCPSSVAVAAKGSAREILPGLILAELDIVSPPVLVGGGITVTGWVSVLCNTWLCRQHDLMEQVL